MKAITQEIQHPLLDKNKVSLFIRREDQIHSVISGNKFRKLRYNLERARECGFRRLITFGGAYSNHILATALAGKACGFATTGIIRGGELLLKWRENPTLRMAHAAGMEFHFVSREDYREKETPRFLRNLEAAWGPAYILPEGGTNRLAVKGCEEILRPEDADFDIICCSVGTGGTLAGLINTSHPAQRVLGFAALKGDHVRKDICKFARRKNWDLQSGYHFGGYAKVTPPLIRFINDFRESYGIPLDPVYTGKMLFGIFDLISRGGFAGNSAILAIHTGGLQGITGMNEKLKKKKLLPITV